MTRTHEIRPDLDEGIDRKVLAQLRARFMALNAGSMAEVFCDQGRLQGMLDFEAGLARAEAQVGLIPETAVAPIAQACLASDRKSTL